MSNSKTTLYVSLCAAVGITAITTAAISYGVFQNTLSQKELTFQNALSQQKLEFQEYEDSQDANMSNVEVERVVPKIKPVQQSEQSACDLTDSSSRVVGLQSEWNFGSGGFATYNWSRPGGERPAYSKPVYLVVRGNLMCIHQTLSRAPFGSQYRCGGLGCDLKRGELISVIGFTDSSEGELIVDSADGAAAFMRGAVCTIETSYLPVMTCNVSRNPVPTLDEESVITFAPAS